MKVIETVTNCLKDSLNKVRGELKYSLLTDGEGEQDISVGTIPSDMEHFKDTKDEWVELINLTKHKDCTAVLYVGKEGSIFRGHKHTASSEQLMIVNPKGKLRILTTKEDVILEYPNSYLIEKNVPHKVYFLTETELIIVWHPPFKQGWEAKSAIIANI